VNHKGKPRDLSHILLAGRFEGDADARAGA